MDFVRGVEHERSSTTLKSLKSVARIPLKRCSLDGECEIRTAVPMPRCPQSAEICRLADPEAAYLRDTQSSTVEGASAQDVHGP